MALPSTLFLSSKQIRLHVTSPKVVSQLYVSRMLFHFQGSPLDLKTQLWPNLLCEFCALPALSRGQTAGSSCWWLQHAPSRHHPPLLSIFRVDLGGQKHVLVTSVATLLTTVICTACTGWQKEEGQKRDKDAWMIICYVYCGRNSDIGREVSMNELILHRKTWYDLGLMIFQTASNNNYYSKGLP